MGIIGNFEKIIFFPTVPTLITALINHPKAAALNLDKRLGLLNSGAAPMPVELIERVQEMGIYFSEGYGLSESTSLGIANPVLGMKKAGSIGIPFPDNDVRLVDVESGTEEVKPGEPGEIIMKGPLIMQGYWNNPRGNRGPAPGRLAPHRRHRPGGRRRLPLHCGPQEGHDHRRRVQHLPPGDRRGALPAPEGGEAVSLGIPDEYRGETVKAFVVLKPGETATDEEIIDFCKQKLTKYKVPTVVEFRDSPAEIGHRQDPAQDPAAGRAGEVKEVTKREERLMDKRKTTFG